MSEPSAAPAPEKENNASHATDTAAASRGDTAYQRGVDAVAGADARPLRGEHAPGDRGAAEDVAARPIVGAAPVAPQALVEQIALAVEALATQKAITNRVARKDPWGIGFLVGCDYSASVVRSFAAGGADGEALPEWRRPPMPVVLPEMPLIEGAPGAGAVPDERDEREMASWQAELDRERARAEHAVGVIAAFAGRPPDDGDNLRDRTETDAKVEPAHDTGTTSGSALPEALDYRLEGVEHTLRAAGLGVEADWVRTAGTALAAVRAERDQAQAAQKALEAARDHALVTLGSMGLRAEDAEARIAAVRALCDNWENVPYNDWPDLIRSALGSSTGTETAP